MKIRKFLALCCAFAALISFTSCDDDDFVGAPTTNVSIKSRTGSFEVAKDGTLTLVGIVKSALPSTYSWTVDGTAYPAATDTIFDFSAISTGQHIVTFTANNNFGSSTATATITVFGKFKTGVFVLNEGWYGHEVGDMFHISSDGVVTENVSIAINGKSFGETAQHMFWGNNKIYVASKGATNRRIVVLDAESLEEVADYSNDLIADGIIKNQSNIAALKNEIFVANGKDMYSFNTTTKKGVKIKNGTVSVAARMYAANNKVFAEYNNYVKVFEENKDTISTQIEFEANIRSIALADDGNLFVALNTNPFKFIKINTKDYSIIKESAASITSSMNGAMMNEQLIWPKGDTIYWASAHATYSSAPVYLYQHIFSEDKTNNIGNITPYLPYGMLYGGIAVNPKTGHVYVSTIGSFAGFLTDNAITVLKFIDGKAPAADNITVIENYIGYTRFAAGIYFPESYNK